ncbi:MAG: UDP-N-acetylglucosamine 2-epimerase (hydrolyzing) [Bacteroidia bacterium]|nr:UDP-N-acetylglucosamine 2-epimerase (hydrolyzing) [Bacteroidia bacterium]
MEIAILTSSRADFGFYKPLLAALKKVKTINAGLVVFGTHLSKQHGYTYTQIQESGYRVFEEIQTQPKGDSPKAIAETIGLVHEKFADYWSKTKYDLIICLGDRYEMFAAVSASVPFNIPVAHISGGEETLGAIDNFYRHALTLMAKYHFTNTKKNAERVKQLCGSSKNVYYTGSLAIDNINSTKLITPKNFEKKFKFNLGVPFILFTFHPETVNYKANIENAGRIKDLLLLLNMAVLITMPNADTMGSIIREKLIEAAKENKRITLVESLGSEGYYTALKYCQLVVGNSSSGIVEAASFNKYVINIGNRQMGRERGKNVIDVVVDVTKILKQIDKINTRTNVKMVNIYGDGKTALRMANVIKKIKSN